MDDAGAADAESAESAIRAAGLQLPIVAMTARAMRGDEERCRAAGMDDYLPKPVRRAALEVLLQRWRPELERRRRDAA